MDASQAQTILDQTIMQICKTKNTLTLEQFLQKYAFDVRLPLIVNDSTTGEQTWAQSVNPMKFMTLNNIWKRVEVDDWILPTRKLNDINDVLAAWNEVNYMGTERQIESVNVAQSDNIYNCENVFRCFDCNRDKNIVFCDSIHDSENIIAGQRSLTSNYCVRLEDSQNCSNSFSVIWSNKVSGSFFMNNCYDVHDSIFCSNLAGKQYCIANMQYDEAEFKRIREMVVKWILTP